MKNESLSGSHKKFSYQELADLERKLYAYLRDNDIYPEDGTFYNPTNPLVDLELSLIIEGDWKHDHQYCEYLVEQFCDKNNFVIVKHSNQEIGNSDSDFYKSEHKWYLCLETENMNKDTVKGFKKLFGESLQSDLGSNYLDIELEDDETAHGGIAFIGETVGDFLSECDVEVNSLDELNKLLKDNGIKPLQKVIKQAINYSSNYVLASRIAKYVFDLLDTDPQEQGRFDDAVDCIYRFLDNMKSLNDIREDNSEIETEEQLRDILKRYTRQTLYRLIDKLEKTTHISYDEYDTWMPPKPVNEDTVKVKDGKWVNKGADGAHGEFRTKKQADAQRKAMFANGFHEDLNDIIDTEPEDKYTFEMWETDEENLEDINLLATVDVSVDEVEKEINFPKTQKYSPLWAFQASKIAEKKWNNPEKKFYSVKIVHDPLRERNMSRFLGKKLLPNRLSESKKQYHLEPRKRIALDGVQWWIPYDLDEQKYSTIVTLGRYKTKKDCQAAIDNFLNSLKSE